VDSRPDVEAAAAAAAEPQSRIIRTATLELLPVLLLLRRFAIRGQPESEPL